MELNEFLAKRYRGIAEAKPNIMMDGSITRKYHSGEFTLEENYFRGNPRVGREIVLLNYNPIWLMDIKEEVKELSKLEIILKFRQKALELAPKNLPIRGTEEILEDGDFRYQAIINGTTDNFNGVEGIWFKKYSQVYHATFHGCKIEMKEPSEVTSFLRGTKQIPQPRGYA